MVKETFNIKIFVVFISYDDLFIAFDHFCVLSALMLTTYTTTNDNNEQ